MWKLLIAAFTALALVAATAAPSTVVLAQTKTEPKKPPTPAQKAQQQKMKDCATAWNAHKKKTGASGQKAHRAFMSDCLKSPETKAKDKKKK